MNPPDSGAAATSAMTGAIRTESRKKSSGAIAKRACDQCKFRKIKASNFFIFYLRSTSGLHPCLLFPFPAPCSTQLYDPAWRANRLSTCSVVYPSHAGHVSPWALTAPFINHRRNGAPLDSEFDRLPFILSTSEATSLILSICRASKVVCPRSGSSRPNYRV